MATRAAIVQTYHSISKQSIIAWRVLQTVVWLIGAAIFLFLVFYPKVGLLLFWNILIPVAPALLVVAGGVWRNVCPLATTNLLPRRLNLSKRKIMAPATQAKLQFAAVIALYLIVPLRHLVFNTNGIATALLLFSAAVIGISMGFVYDSKSGWCNTLCPIHPVEKLYGGNTLVSVPNVQCDKCVNCTVPCPDSTPNFHPSLSKKTFYNQLSGVLTIGGLLGFIFGWFQVPDYAGPITPYQLLVSFIIPLACLCATTLLYVILRRLFKKKNEKLLINCFAAAAVSCYYWFRLPALFGFGKFAGDAILLNFRGIVPAWSFQVTVIFTTAFFTWWLVLRKPSHKSAAIRPQFAKSHRHSSLSA